MTASIESTLKCTAEQILCHGAMSRWCSSVSILSELFVLPEPAAATVPVMCIITDHSSNLCTVLLEMPAFLHGVGHTVQLIKNQRSGLLVTLDMLYE